MHSSSLNLFHFESDQISDPATDPVLQALVSTLPRVGQWSPKELQQRYSFLKASKRYQKLQKSHEQAIGDQMHKSLVKRLHEYESSSSNGSGSESLY